ncbi:MAG: Uma2 family endonuclease [Roseiflexaceae bacterium]
MSFAIAIDEMILQIDASGAPVRFEYVRGRMKWEMSPASRHQLTIRQIERSIEPLISGSDCACFALADVLIRFPDPDQSLKRPDIAIFCRQPPAVDEALTLLPAAVIEVVSSGYEEKDLGPDGAPFYLAYGVPEVLVVDPRLELLYHYRVDRPIERHPTPHSVQLLCGCAVQIPSASG